MTFPKAVMTISELEAMGFTRSFLRDLLRRHGDAIAFRTSGGGKWMVDTEKLGAFLQGGNPSPGSKTARKFPMRTARRGKHKDLDPPKTCKELIC